MSTIFQSIKDIALISKALVFPYELNETQIFIFHIDRTPKI